MTLEGAALSGLRSATAVSAAAVAGVAESPALQIGGVLALLVLAFAALGNTQVVVVLVRNRGTERLIDKLGALQSADEMQRWLAIRQALGATGADQLRLEPGVDDPPTTSAPAPPPASTG